MKFTYESERTALENRIELLEAENRHLLGRSSRAEEALQKKTKELQSENETLNKAL